MDSSSGLDYRLTQNGEIGGSIVSDTNENRNLVLVMKTIDDKSCEIEILIDIKEIPPRQQPPPVEQPIQHPQQPQQQQPQMYEQYDAKELDKKPGKSLFSLYNICVVLAIGVAIGLVYFYFIKKPKQSKEVIEVKEMSPAVSPTPSGLSIAPSPVPSVASSDHLKTQPTDTVSDLLNRINKIDT